MLLIGVRSLVKLFESVLAIKEDAKLISWKRKFAQGVPPRRVGEVSYRSPIMRERQVLWLVLPITALITYIDRLVYVKFDEVNMVCSHGLHVKDIITNLRVLLVVRRRDLLEFSSH